MAKRIATRDLNHDNWEEEEEVEEVGTFSRASNEELKRRVIKKAVRRLPETGESKISAFSGFTGFAGVTPKPAASTFSFLSNVGSSNSSSSSSGDANKKDEAIKLSDSTDSSKKMTNGNSSTYASDIKALNVSFLKWVTKCVDENPLCILTPLFDDYKKYLKEIEDSKNKPKQSDSGNVGKTEEKKSLEKGDKVLEVPASASTFKFGSAATSTATAQKPTSTFSFGTTTSSAPSTNTPFSLPPFGSTTASKPFSFGSSTPFTFGNVTQAPKPAEEKKDETEGDDNEEPPKNEFTPVVEDDSLYSKRCKVFVKNEKEYKERGVGTLYVKSVESGAKTQVIVRADTSLGNLLLNTLLSKELTLKKIGKKDVMIVVAEDQKPTPILLRVKTPEDADELLEALEKNKK